MIFAYDTEFLEDGVTIELISIGIVCEDGSTYYAVNSDAPWERIAADYWLCENVVTYLPLVTGSFYKPAIKDGPYSFIVDPLCSQVKPAWVIANEVRDFLLQYKSEPELWADYSAYDHVVLAQLYGKMIDLPGGIPMYTNDLQQLKRKHGFNSTGVESSSPHNALADAEAVMKELKWHGVVKRLTGIKPNSWLDRKVREQLTEDNDG